MKLSHSFRLMRQAAWPSSQIATPELVSVRTGPRSFATWSSWVALAGIVALAAVLRFTGLRWGIPTPEIPHYAFHPDEAWAMDVLKEIDVATGRFNPVSAHSEGTFPFYLWTLAALVARGLGLISQLPSGIVGYGVDYRRVLYLGRAVGVVADLASVALIYLTILKIVKDRNSALLGALIFAIFPFEVIYAHYLRGHVIANFFTVLTIYLSTWLYEREDTRVLVAAGMAAGIAAGTRYPAAMALGIPIAFLFYKRAVVEKGLRLDLKSVWRCFVHWSYWKVGGSFLLGFLVADPYLFLQYSSARAGLERQAEFVAKDQFTLVGLFDLSRVWVYIEYLIPYAALPALWTLLYFGVLYVVVLRKRYPYTLPLMAFLGVYLYFIAKGYYLPVFIRGAMGGFPVLSIFAALAMGDLWRRLSGRRWLQGAVGILVAAVVGSTLFFDAAYLASMNREDPRIQMYRYFANEVTQPKVVIGVHDGGWDAWIFRPALDQIRNKPIEFVTDPNRLQRIIAGQDPGEVDYFIVWVNMEGEQPPAEAAMRKLSESGRYKLEREFSNRIELFGIPFDPARRPGDLIYPFPKLYLFKRV